ncbi:MAG: hypothetical protein GXP31_12185 [Kiritimatiellaeota bacterium]|nr:hypothetical protein [Kiritimatiellota bacterium]
MRTIHDLSGLEWRLSGWHPHYWRGTVSVESGMRLAPDVGPIPARVPGSVQQALREAGILRDWNVKLDSRICEWVENRHWVFETTLPGEWTRGPGRHVLECSGLDYRGAVLVNGREVGAFCNTFIPHVFDVTDFLQPDANRLSIVFTGVPEFLGQIGWTSRIADWKERFNYGWDWVPRLVQVGIWDEIRLVLRRGDSFDAMSLYTETDAGAGVGVVTFEAGLSLAVGEHVEVTVTGESGEIVHQVRVPVQPTVATRIGPFPVDLWQPNGCGAQPLYDVRFRLLDRAEKVLDGVERRVGFRQVEWGACNGAPPEATPWICTVNGRPTFLQGFNWAPIRPFFADVTEADYRRLLEVYRNLGTNLLRVWGGAVLEKECFYRLCDEFGIMVWQEFPLSSSGIDNWPPEAPEIVEEMECVVESYIRRRQHHPSLIVWCGGNELQGGLDGSKQGGGKPVDAMHPMISSMSRVVARLDPGRRFLATSSSGPRFTGDPAEFGKGLHWDVHGPWNHRGPLETWRDYWDRDDALFRSEVGMPGAAAADLIREFGQDMAWPADRRVNPWYGLCGGWWDQWEEYLEAGGDPDSLDAYVTWSQARQSEALAYVARRCKERFPAMGGVLFWMGHDCFPCPVNTAVIDVRGRPKPAGEALGKVFRSPLPDRR